MTSSAPIPTPTSTQAPDADTAPEVPEEGVTSDQVAHAQDESRAEGEPMEAEESASES
jgi:hypothetical protein